MAETYEVIVVGGGFAGIEAATKLGRVGVRTLLVDVHGYHQFQPLLYQLATAQIGVSELARPLRSIFRKQPSVRVLTARVAAVDPGRRTITLTDGTVYEADDALIVACGAEANFFDTPGARENAYPLYSATDATRLGSKLVALLDQADKDNGQKPMNVAVVGAGPTGVETAGAIADAINYVVPKLFVGDLAKRCSVALVDMVDRTLGGFSKKSQAYAASRLVERGVRLKLGSAVTEVRKDGLSFADGATMDADLVIWAAASRPVRCSANRGCRRGVAGASTSPRTSPSRATRACTCSGTPPTSPTTGTSGCPSSAPSPSSPGPGPPATSSPSGPGGRPSRSATRTGATWR
ncbi:NAD(P)/FAD-dependent oxidoreductase [Actinomadura keratinilytica]